MPKPKGKLREVRSWALIFEEGVESWEFWTYDFEFPLTMHTTDWRNYLEKNPL